MLIYATERTSLLCVVNYGIDRVINATCRAWTRPGKGGEERSLPTTTVAGCPVLFHIIVLISFRECIGRDLYGMLVQYAATIILCDSLSTTTAAAPPGRPERAAAQYVSSHRTLFNISVDMFCIQTPQPQPHPLVIHLAHRYSCTRKSPLTDDTATSWVYGPILRWPREI